MKGKLTFNTDRCKGCGLCVSVCPVKILALQTGQVNGKGYSPVQCLDMNRCTSCGSCALICPDSIIRVEREEE